jgi:cytochrome c oxidase cbb3-type subunit 3
MKWRYLLLHTISAIVLTGVIAGSWPLHAANQGSATSPAVGLPPAGDMARVPLGELVENPDRSIASGITNPAAGRPEAVEQGRQLFAQMNCAGCHGYDATGGVGPNLTTKYWRYGGTPVAIYKSIYEGRPQGMPAWGRTLPPESIWLLVAYIQSFGGSFPAEAYQASLQGDRPSELVAPELTFEQSLNGPVPPAVQSQARGKANPQPRNTSGQR